MTYSPRRQGRVSLVQEDGMSGARHKHRRPGSGAWLFALCLAATPFSHAAPAMERLDPIGLERVCFADAATSLMFADTARQTRMPEAEMQQWMKGALRHPDQLRAESARMRRFYAGEFSGSVDYAGASMEECMRRLRQRLAPGYRAKVTQCFYVTQAGQQAYDWRLNGRKSRTEATLALVKQRPAGRAQITQAVNAAYSARNAGELMQQLEAQFFACRQ